MTVAGDFLSKLFDRAQTAFLRGRPPARLVLSRAQCPAYFEMRDLNEAEAFRGELQAAAHAGAISIEPSPGNRWPRDVHAIVVRDTERLASVLGHKTIGTILGDARTALGSHLEAHPILTEVLAAWSVGNRVRRRGAEDVDAMVAATLVVDARKGASQDALIRRESIRLLGNSKSIEALVPWIEILVTADLAPSGLTADETLAALGLFREPQPLLIAGAGTALVAGARIPLIVPFLGLPTAAINSFAFDKEPRFVLTIENKQTFHEAARLEGATDGLLLYTGGMPSPAWMRAYTLLLAAIPDSVSCFHFGDLDLGGFRIAAAIGRTASAASRQLAPWGMAPDVYLQSSIKLKAVASSTVDAMERKARELRWDVIADRLLALPGTAEQEAILPLLPTPNVLGGHWSSGYWAGSKPLSQLGDRLSED